MPAVQKYLAANRGILPPDLFQLKPYFEMPVTDEMLTNSFKPESPMRMQTWSD